MKDSLILRRAAIDVFGDIHPLDYNAQAYMERIKQLPSAQPERNFLSGLTPEEQYNKINWLLHDYGMQYTDTRHAVIDWLEKYSAQPKQREDAIGVNLHVAKISKHCSDFSDLEEAEPCEDAVSRAEIVRWTHFWFEAVDIKPDRFLAGIERLPSVTPKAEQRWIPVSKELPDDLDEVNITWINNDPEPYYDFVKGKSFTGSAVFYKGDWYWYSSVTVDVLAEYGRCDTEKMDKGIKVTAWMPLPEPYREEGKK